MATVAAVLVASGVATAADERPALTVPAEKSRAQPRRARHDERAIIDCNWPGAWRPLEGWGLAKVSP